MFRSAAFRRCAIVLVAIGAIVEISVGITKALQQRHDLPDWEGMLVEEEEEQSVYQPVFPLEPNNPSSNSKESNSQEISEMYQ